MGTNHRIALFFILLFQPSRRIPTHITKKSKDNNVRVSFTIGNAKVEMVEMNVRLMTSDRNIAPPQSE